MRACRNSVDELSSPSTMVSPVQLLWLRTQLALDILLTMDNTASPCDDFYKFACGNYKTMVKLPDDRASMSPMVRVSQQIYKELKAVLEQNDTDHSPSSTLVRRFYQSCTDVPSMESLGLESVKRILKRFGGWPVLEGDAWNGSQGYDWVRHNALLTRQAGISNILEFSIGPDYKNSSIRILHVDQPSLGMGKRDYYLNKNYSKRLDEYVKYMIDSAVLLGAKKEWATKEMEAVIAFEKDLAEISVRDEGRRDIDLLYKPMTVAELINRFDEVNISSWFDYMSSTNAGFYHYDIVNVDGEPFLKALPKVISKYPARTLANYQLWFLIYTLTPYFPPSRREHYRRYTQSLTGTPKFKPRWEECVGELLAEVPLPTGALYVKKYFSEESKKEIDKVMVTIRDSMNDTIERTDWMDDSTKKYALYKLSKMVQNMAYSPDGIHNETWLMKSHKKAQIREGQYLENILQLISSTVDRLLEEYRIPVNRTEWREGFATVNAWYSGSKNKMTFPAGILRYPFFAHYFPSAVSYGRIGAVMGHELTHGFDDTGRQFDADGNLVFWWTNTTIAEFKQGAKCFINQYSSVKDKTTLLNLNGENTQGENIADNGGVKLAYKAYQSRLARDGDGDEYLPHLKEYSPEQLFFISYGQVWCNLMRPETLQRQIITDPHSPSEYRVNVVLQNNDQFAKAFDCPVGSPMNPKKKCKIW